MTHQTLNQSLRYIKNHLYTFLSFENAYNRKLHNYKTDSCSEARFFLAKTKYHHNWTITRVHCMLNSHHDFILAFSVSKLEITKLHRERALHRKWSKQFMMLCLSAFPIKPVNTNPAHKRWSRFKFLLHNSVFDTNVLWDLWLVDVKTGGSCLL